MVCGAVPHEPGPPWFKTSEEAVYNGDVSGAMQEGQAGIQSTLDRVQN